MKILKRTGFEDDFTILLYAIIKRYTILKENIFCCSFRNEVKMFDFLKKKQLPSDTKQPSTELVVAEPQETAICEIETKMIAKITLAELMEYMNNGQLVEIKNTVAAGLSKVVEHLPEMAARKGMDNLYRLDMNGVKGVLMSHGSGNTTTIIDETTKKIKAISAQVRNLIVLRR